MRAGLEITQNSVRVGYIGGGSRFPMYNFDTKYRFIVKSDFDWLFAGGVSDVKARLSGSPLRLINGSIVFHYAGAYHKIGQYVNYLGNQVASGAVGFHL